MAVSLKSEHFVPLLFLSEVIISPLTIQCLEMSEELIFYSIKSKLMSCLETDSESCMLSRPRYLL